MIGDRSHDMIAARQHGIRGLGAGWGYGSFDELIAAGADALAVIPLLPAMYDEPFADSSQIPTHLVSKAARQHVTVALSGDAGDELFGGYNRYFWGQRVWSRLSWMPPMLLSISPSRWFSVPLPAEAYW